MIPPMTLEKENKLSITISTLIVVGHCTSASVVPAYNMSPPTELELKSLYFPSSAPPTKENYYDKHLRKSTKVGGPVFV